MNELDTECFLRAILNQSQRISVISGDTFKCLQLLIFVLSIQWKSDFYFLIQNNGKKS